MPPRSKKTAARPRRTPAAHLLFVECQTTLLHSQGLALATPWHARFSAAHPAKQIQLAATDTRAELTSRLGELTQAGTRYRTIVLIAHSNSHGLQLTREDYCSWSVLGAWLKAVSPEHLVLIACNAGRVTGVCELFQSVPSLKTVYASPVPVSPQHAKSLDLLLHQLLMQRRVDDVVLRIAQVAGYLTSKAILFRWRRADCQKQKTFEGHLFGAVAQFLQ